MEDDLRERGYAEARVRVELSPASPEDPPRIAAIFAVEAGPAERVGSFSVEGLSRTSASLGPEALQASSRGASSAQNDLARAQADVFALGLFESVKAAERPAARTAASTSSSRRKSARRSRSATASGGRTTRGWPPSSTSSTATSSVAASPSASAVLYDPDDRAVRAFGAPSRGLLGLGVEGWYERRRTWREGLFGDRQTDTSEASLQLSRTLSEGLSARLYGRYRTSRIFEDDPSSRST